jgi:endonuclease III
MSIQTVKVLLERHGLLYAEEAGIRLADRPSPLYQLLVLSTLLSARISASIAVAAARELFAAGYTTPKAMTAATWQARVDALGRGHYRRYDESTATRLGDGASLLTDRWGGDLRRLRDEALRDAGAGAAQAIASLLNEFPGVGAVGASIFIREVQDTWPVVAPYVDPLVLRGARRVGLPGEPGSLARVLSGSGQPVRLAAALVRVGLSERAAADVVASAS